MTRRELLYIGLIGGIVAVFEFYLLRKANVK